MKSQSNYPQAFIPLKNPNELRTGEQDNRPILSQNPFRLSGVSNSFLAPAQFTNVEYMNFNPAATFMSLIRPPGNLENLNLPSTLIGMVTGPTPTSNVAEVKTVNNQSCKDSDSFSTSASLEKARNLNNLEAKLESEEDQNIPSDSPINSNVSQTPSENKSKDKELSPQEEETLMELAVKHRNNWKKIAKFIFNMYNKKFTPHYLKTKHKELLTKQKKERVKFTHEEDLQIVKYLYEYGIDWGKIASHFTNRTPVMIKNRYYSFIRKKGLTQHYMNQMQDVKHEEKDVGVNPTSNLLMLQNPLINVSELNNLQQLIGEDKLLQNLQAPPKEGVFRKPQIAKEMNITDKGIPYSNSNGYLS